MNNGYDRRGQITTALLLAAGTGSRLQPLTNDAPKCLTEINGISLLERQLSCLRQRGFKRLVVVVGYLEHGIRDFLDQRASGPEIDYVVTPRYRTTRSRKSPDPARATCRNTGRIQNTSTA